MVCCSARFTIVKVIYKLGCHYAFQFSNLLKNFDHRLVNSVTGKARYPYINVMFVSVYREEVRYFDVKSVLNHSVLEAFSESVGFELTVESCQ